MKKVETTIGNRDIHSQVIRYCNLGLQPIPVRFGEKHPMIKNWPELRVRPETAPEYFNDANQNVGIKLERIADLDCDILEAIAAARILAPETNWKFGRQSKPDSHRIYTVQESLVIEQYRDPTDKGMIVELRSLK